MRDIQSIRSFDQLKVLSDARRLRILRLLMASPATLSQLGRALGEHPAWVRHHLKLLEKAGLVELAETREQDGFVEKYYRARARAFSFQHMLLSIECIGDNLLILGSHDLALEMLAGYVNQTAPENQVMIISVGSLEGLVALRQGVTRITGCHLLDRESGEFNVSYVRHLFPDQAMRLVTLAYREQGLILASSNPHHVHGLEDLVSRDLTFINRNRGSGTRIWLDGQLRMLGIQTQTVRGYDNEVSSHTALAEAILRGQADWGIGLIAAALRFGLGFIPLFRERYDLVFPEEYSDNPSILHLLETMQSSRYHRMVDNLGGYETTHTGNLISL